MTHVAMPDLHGPVLARKDDEGDAVTFTHEHSLTAVLLNATFGKNAKTTISKPCLREGKIHKPSPMRLLWRTAGDASSGRPATRLEARKVKNAAGLGLILLLAAHGRASVEISLSKNSRPGRDHWRPRTPALHGQQTFLWKKPMTAAEARRSGRSQAHRRTAAARRPDLVQLFQRLTEGRELRGPRWP